MADYDNTNSGAMFPNNKKRGKNSPDYTGSLDVEGTEYWCSGWVKTSRNGKEYLSVALTLKEEQPSNAPAPLPKSLSKQSDMGQNDEPAPARNDKTPAFPSESGGMDDAPF